MLFFQSGANISPGAAFKDFGNDAAVWNVNEVGQWICVGILFLNVFHRCLRCWP